MRRQIANRKSQIANCVMMLLFGIFLFLAPRSFAVEPLSKKVDEQAAQFKLADLSGKEVALSDFAGKPVMLFFWATWCPYCRDELPTLQSQYNDIKEAGIGLLAIDVGEPKERVERILKKESLEFPVLLDTDSSVSTSYNLVGIPTYILIDARGKIKSRSHNFPKDYKNILK